MGIYDRSNIDYSGMIRDMINARTAGAKIAADNIRNQGELWGNFAKDIGGVASRTWDAAHLNDTDMPGIANYVAFGDSSLLDRQLAEAAARRQMAEQQAFQAEESDLNRALQERIARMNRASAYEDKMDEYELNYRKAIAARNSAETALKFDKSDDPTVAEMLKRNLTDANASVAYWGKKLNKNSDTVNNIDIGMKELNREEPTAETVDEPKPEEVITQQDQGQIVDAEISTTNWNNAAKKKAIDAANKLKDPGDRAKAMKAIENKGDTKEEAAAKAKEKLDKADKEFQSLDVIGQDNYLEEHKEYTVKDGHLKYKGK